MREFAEWLYLTPLSVAIHSTFWLFRLLQASHLLTAGVAVGSGVMIALRAVGWQRADEPFETVWRRFAPWLTVSLVIMAATGIAQTIADPVREFTATSYWLKLTLLLVCLLGTALLARAADGRRELPFVAKLAVVALILCWLALPLLGRTIGYDLAIFGSWSLRT